MEFLYNPNPSPTIEWTGEQYKYLFRVRRLQAGERVPVRNLRDDHLYLYQIVEVDRRRGVGRLVE
ncbi:MAG: RNA methyltransferase PUA domain-containing protein, partial [Campylobacterales bacterium]